MCLDKNKIGSIFAWAIVSNLQSCPFSMAFWHQNILESGSFRIGTVTLTSSTQMISLSFVVTLNTDVIIMFEIVGVSFAETSFHCLIHTEHNAVTLSFFGRNIGSKVGTDIVFVGYGISSSFWGILSWQEHGSFSKRRNFI